VSALCMGLGVLLLAASGIPPAGTAAALPPGVHIAPHERVEISIPSLDIPSGLYGPQQARALLNRIRAREGSELGRVEEVPLPNVPGKFKMYLVEWRMTSRPVWLRAILKKRGDAWALQSVREVQRF